ncbi:MAG TPA: FkbM family methyltransferase [Rhizomicrobium sp.]|nr:FkbM family methyltransferase [Rhizomicrobium sp.]
MGYRHHLGNDRFILEKVFPNRRKGFFIEAGATNGINGSASYVMETEYDWNGICFEPIPQQFEQLLKNRKCYADRRCLWSRSGEILEFDYFPKHSGRSGISSRNKNAEALNREKSEKIVLRKETVTLLEALRCFKAPRAIEYLNLDVEGAEREIFSAFPFDGPYTILAVSIEGPGCDDIFQRNGYTSVINPFSDKMFERYYVHPGVPTVSSLQRRRV